MYGRDRKTAREAYGLASLVPVTQKKQLGACLACTKALGSTLALYKLCIKADTYNPQKVDADSEFKVISCLQSKFKVNLEVLTQKRGRVGVSSDQINVVNNQVGSCPPGDGRQPVTNRNWRSDSQGSRRRHIPSALWLPVSSKGESWPPMAIKASHFRQLFSLPLYIQPLLFC